jgi:hypothetical protein
MGGFTGVNQGMINLLFLTRKALGGGRAISYSHAPELSTGNGKRPRLAEFGPGNDDPCKSPKKRKKEKRILSPLKNFPSFQLIYILFSSRC